MVNSEVMESSGPAEDYRVEQGVRTAQGWAAVMEAHRRGGDPGLGQIVEGGQFSYQGNWEAGPSLYDYVLEGLLPMPALMGYADWNRFEGKIWLLTGRAGERGISVMLLSS